MNSRLSLLFIGFCTIGGVFASVEEDRESLMAEQGYNPLKPSKTLKLLKNLANAGNVDQQNTVLMKKEEIDDLIKISHVTEENCNQEFVTRINNMLLKYSNALLNLVPYLKYNKQKLLTDCADKYNVKDLNPEVDIPGRPAYDSESEPDPETPEEKAAREAEEAKRREVENEKMEKVRREKKEKQDNIDEGWAKQYNRIFYERKDLFVDNQNLESMVEVFGKLYNSHKDTSESAELKQKGSNVLELLKLAYIFANNCNDKKFEQYDDLVRKYANGDYSSSITDYIKYQRWRFWRACRQAFINGQKEEGINQDDEVEAFSLVDNVMARSPYSTLRELHLLNNIQSIDDAVLNYIRNKLGKKAHKKEKIDSLFSTTIKPVCYSVRERFLGIEKIAEIIEHHSDFKYDMDDKSMKWLTAMAVCKLILENSTLLHDKALSTFQAQREEAKKNSCVGKLLGRRW